MNDKIYGNDYNKIRDFLIDLNNHNYHYGRWDWMVSNLSAYWADPEGINKIGIWEKNEKIIAISTYDTSLGKAFLLTLNGYEYLKNEMLEYSKLNLSKNGSFSVCIFDNDKEMQNMVYKNNFFPTQNKEFDSIYLINDKIDYALPNGFKIISLKENFDLYKYGQVLWKGFNHEINGEGPFDFFYKRNMQYYESVFEGPNVNLNIKIAVVAPNGDFVSYCGMWYDINTENALVEPVATEPAYRKMGLGKAAVLEGIKRCGELGAKKAFVCSSQQFYYNIGFRPYTTSTCWEEKNK
jgi:GNAT superfamily N-acetyltransferase